MSTEAKEKQLVDDNLTFSGIQTRDVKSSDLSDLASNTEKNQRKMAQV